MAHAARIDDVITLQTGQVEVRYTEGESPLPLAWSGMAVVEPSMGAFVDKLAQTEADMETLLKYLQLAKGYKADPSLGLTFQLLTKGKTITMDLTGIAAPITLG